MVISNLDCLEVVSGSDVAGGSFFFSKAKANANAIAVGGKITIAKTETFAGAAPGIAEASSKSKAVSAG